MRPFAPFAPLRSSGSGSAPTTVSKASKRYHNRVAKKYDAIYDDVYWQFHDAVTWELVKPLLPTDANARCFDVGCGTGKWGFKLMKSGYRVLFGDHSPAMVGEVRGKLDDDPKLAEKAEAVEADIARMPQVESGAFALTLGMGDPISMCFDPQQAANELFRVTRPGGVVVVTADNRMSAADAYLNRGDIDGLSKLLKTGRTHWLTGDASEQFTLHTFTPGELQKLFERSGFEVLSVVGKTVLPIREHRDQLEDRDTYRRLLKLELSLNRDPLLASRAGHLQIAARRP